MINKGCFNLGQSILAEGDATVAPPVYDPEGSLKFDSAQSQYLEWIPKTDGNRKTWIYSIWFKCPSGTDTNLLRVKQSADFAYLRCFENGGISVTNAPNSVVNATISSTVSFNDSAEWYHAVFFIDTTNPVSTERLKIFINGIRLDGSQLPSPTYPALNTELLFNQGGKIYSIGMLLTETIDDLYEPYDGNMAEIAFIDGDNTSTINNFGYFDAHGVWRPSNLHHTIDKGKWTGNSFYLPLGKSRVTQEGIAFGSYTATGQENNKVKCGFTPDLILTKASGVGSVENPDMFLRTLGIDKRLHTSRPDGVSTGNFLNSFDPDGFSLGTELGSNNPNFGTFKYLALQDNPKYGFDIVKYNGNGQSSHSVGHDLGVLPEMVIIKRLDGAHNWHVWHKDLGGIDKYLVLNRTQIVGTSSGDLYQSVTTEEVTFGNHPSWNANGSEYIMLVFASVDNFCKIGTYTGNGTGQDIHCGFRPTLVMHKMPLKVSEWYFFDQDNHHYMASSTAISPSSSHDFTEQGFRINSSSTDKWIYIAWADTSVLDDVLKSDTTEVQLEAHNMDPVANQSKDSPENNQPIFTLKSLSSANSKITNGGRDILLHAAVNGGFAFGSTNIKTKSYFEVFVKNAGNPSPIAAIGLAYDKSNYTTATDIQAALYFYSGSLATSSGSAPYGDGYVTGDIIGVEVDPELNEVTFFKNGVSQGTHVYDASHPVRPFIYHATSFASFSEYKVTELDISIPSASVKNPGIGFKTIAYMGNGARNEFNIGFQPDLVWIKRRTLTASHVLHNSVNGFDKWHQTDNVNPLGGAAMLARTENGFDILSGGAGIGENWNALNHEYVAWCWKASPALGFDIVKYTGNGAPGHVVPHACGGEPEFMTIKATNANSNWTTFLPKELGTSRIGALNSPNGFGTDTPGDGICLESVAETDFTLGSQNANAYDVNDVGTEYIAYLWRSIDGFSKIGTYKGNGNLEGPFINCGFTPSLVLIKNSTAAANWIMVDSARSEYNPVQSLLYPNLTNAATENTVGTTAGAALFNSNGFKPVSTHAHFNANGQDYIYMAFAENPFEHTRAR